jgi:hypothetical protein
MSADEGLMTTDQALAVILNSLAAKAAGDSFDEDRLLEAATTCVVRQMAAMGLRAAAIIRNLEEREHTFRFHYSEDQGLTVEVEWLDGSATIDVDLDLQEVGRG